MRRFFNILAVTMLLGGCNKQSNARFAFESAEDPRNGEYVIGVSDTLSINVWRDPELSTDVTVRPDGTITLPLVGDLSVAGRTPSRVKVEVAQRLQQYVKDAVVTVAVAEVNSYRFTVAGEVAHPGVFASKSFVTVSEALALAGGPTRYASVDEVVLARAKPGSVSHRIIIDYSAILEGEHPEQNIVVLAGDTLYVP